MMYDCYAIVCTNKKLLFMNINSRITRPAHFLFQMSYEDIKKMKQGKKTSMALNFGLHWDPKEGYKSMETPAVVLLASFSRFTRFCALILELFDPLQCTRVRSAYN
jgi:hypothetical protein